jgi:RimJ/RimL family protein N-acetyltransferase
MSGGSSKVPIRIGLVGDFDAAVVAHRAIPLALERAGAARGVRLEPVWLPTERLVDAIDCSAFAGLWCVPASPYRSMDGALRAIRFARERGVPFLGTCGGFQHAVIEYARDVLGWNDAEHAETAPDAAHAVIAPLECALVEATGTVHFGPGTRIASAYGASSALEGYHCRYGLNPAFASQLVAGPLRATARDEAGEVRAVELDGHSFFVATLFQPERAALAGRLPPLVAAFVDACLAQQAGLQAADAGGDVVCETERLVLRRLTAADAGFILELLNDPGFIRYIGDRGVRTLADAGRYIEDGPAASYARHGFGLYLVALKDGGAPIGISGLVKREGLDDVDVGFAFLSQYRAQGYARESAQAALRQGYEEFGLPRIVAITAPDNHDSMKLLRKLGLKLERMIQLPGQGQESCLFTPEGRE